MVRMFPLSSRTPGYESKTASKLRLLFASAAESATAHGPDLKALHAKIGQQALEIDFLAGALGRIGDASAKK